MVGGILAPLEFVLTWLLELGHAAGLDWAWAIVALTVAVRLALLPLAVRLVHSMQRLQRLQPQLLELQKLHQDDKAKLQAEVMEFYKREQVNPAASCLPLVLQLPVFIALFFVLRDFERDVLPDHPTSTLEWLSFVPDITAPVADHWSGFLLAGVYLLSQLGSGWLSTRGTTGPMRFMVLILPFLIVPFILYPPVAAFPVGLLIYWLTTNLWTIGQTLAVRRLLPTPVTGQPLPPL